MRLFALATAAWLLAGGAAVAQEGEKPFVPEVGQPGKDVVWVPTPDVLVEHMLDLAGATPDDLLMDLGSGDGRIVIAAAKRGIPAIGVEYSIRMHELAQRNAKIAGVSDKARFVQGDMYLADVSKATVLALFLLPGNLNKLRDSFMTMAPGSRIVSNEYRIEAGGWQPERVSVLPDCDQTWCKAVLYIVPAKVEGTWKAADGTVTFEQHYQELSGTVNGRSLLGRLRGTEVWFTDGDAQYFGQVKGDVIEGTVWRDGTPAAWKATKS